ncbi:MAG: hypothetical protein AMXMBFR78_35140 [Rubrivivax sp.]|jgi:putative addiction module killer protein|nr:type II toxin-antitoxin system RelE/ParE family toxin [Rubrivivax sp.]
MFRIETTEPFEAWLAGLQDGMTRRRLLVRLKKASLGNLGDVAPVGDGVSEMREHFGAGWRLYYIQQGEVLIVMLGGGTKATQSRDIEKARAQARLFRKE